jgi:hypothetical protein
MERTRSDESISISHLKRDPDCGDCVDRIPALFGRAEADLGSGLDRLLLQSEAETAYNAQDAECSRPGEQDFEDDVAFNASPARFLGVGRTGLIQDFEGFGRSLPYRGGLTHWIRGYRCCECGSGDFRLRCWHLRRRRCRDAAESVGGSDGVCAVRGCRGDARLAEGIRGHDRGSFAWSGSSYAGGAESGGERRSYWRVPAGCLGRDRTERAGYDLEFSLGLRDSERNPGKRARLGSCSAGRRRGGGQGRCKDGGGSRR